MGKGVPIYVYSQGQIKALEVPDVPDEKTDIELALTTDDYVAFGSDNLFPQALIELMRNSSVHRGIINNKRIYAVGSGFTIDNKDIEAWLGEANANKEPFKNIYSKLQLDHIAFGNAFFEIVTDAKRSFVNVYHKDASKFRISKDKTMAIWHPDWSYYETYKDQSINFPLYPNFGKQPGSKFLHSIYHIKQYEPGSDVYGVPAYISGLNSAGIIYKTDKWNLSRLDNSFKPSGVLIVDAEMSPDDAKDFEEKFDEKFTGEGATGKVMKIVKENSQNTRFISLNDNYEGDWTLLHKQSEGNIITAHNWFRSLSGIADNTGFDTQRILNEYEVAKNTVILDQQNAVLDCVRAMLNQMKGWDAATMEVINRPPTSFAQLLNLNRITKIWEGRKLVGLEYDPDDEQQNRYIDNGNATNNAAGDNK